MKADISETEKSLSFDGDEPKENQGGHCPLKSLEPLENPLNSVAP